MKISLAYVGIGISIYQFVCIFYVEFRVEVPLLEISEAAFCPVEFLGLAVVVVALHNRKEGLIVDDSFFLFIHVVKQILFFVVSKLNNLIDIFEPSFMSDEPASYSIEFPKEIIIADLFFDSFFS